MLSKPRPKLKFSLLAGWKRHLAAFALVALVITLPLQALTSYAGLLKDAGAIAADAKIAVGSLKEGSFQRSAGAFASTRDRVDNAAVRLAALLTGNGGKLSSGANLLGAGESVAKAGAELSAGYDEMSRLPGTNSAKLAKMAAALERALPSLERGSAELQAVRVTSLPKSVRGPFQQIRADVEEALEDVKRVSRSSGILLDAVGANGKRRYLIVFQNSRELRPTGGFIGSFALMDLKDGEIRSIEIPGGGSYDLRAGLNLRIAAPEQLRLVNARWEFQDANWFADFPTSAQALSWFYEKSGGPTVDGVIAVTSNLMVDLLRAVGPIEMPSQGKVITADNFMDETQKAVEIEYDHAANRPKQIISDMMPKLLKKIVDGANLPELAGAFGKALSTKDIQVYLREESAQAAAKEFGWTGELRPIERADYLNVVDTNIAGGKTDGKIEETIRHESEVQKDGSIVDTLTITRAHHGISGELFSGIKNIDYQRVYVPKGSELLSAEGYEKPGQGYFLPADSSLQPSTLLSAIQGKERTDATSGTSIHEESDLTVFGNWIQVEPGESRTVKLRYKLPFAFQDIVKQPASFERAAALIGAYVPTAEFKLVVQRQPGAPPRSFESRIALPDGWRARSSVPEQAMARGRSLNVKVTLDNDLYVGAVLVKR